MVFGVLEDQRVVNLPGTVDLRVTGDLETAQSTSDGKKGGNIILQPQPDRSPDDPLNWSNTWKYSILFLLTFGSGVTTAITSMPTPGLPIISKQFNISLDLVSSLIIGAFGFWTALASFFTAAGSDIYGKRPFYVISIAALCISNIWGFASKSFASLVTSRILAGMAAAPLTTLVTASISDLFFVHQRGTMLGVWNLMQSSGIQMGQIISGFVFEKLGTPAVFGLTAVIYGLLALAAYFLCLETTYVRLNVQTKGLSDESDDELAAKNEPEAPERPYREQLALFNGKLTTAPFWKGVIKPIPLLAFPTIIYPTILFSAYFCLVVSMSVLSATIFAAPPYNLSSAQVGLTNLSVLFASLFGSPLAGWLADCAVKIMSRKNKTAPGRVEAEFRLVLVGIAMPLAAIGLFGFGFSVRNGLALPFPLMFMAFFTMGFVFVAQSVLAYMIDVHTDDVSQAYTAMNIVASVVVFVASSYINGWYMSAGPSVVFGVLGGMSVAVSLLTVPMYIYGKRIRSMVFSSRLAQKM